MRIIRIDKEKLSDIIKDSYSYNDACMKYYGYSNAKSITKIRAFVFQHALDVSHFGSKNRKYKIVEKICPVCKKVFNIKEGCSRKQTTCSCACSNVYFRAGENNGNWKQGYYTTTCFEYHSKECIICGEKNIVAVHHYDKNHSNNKPENLIPMCPTHHIYMHSRFATLLEERVTFYIINWKKNQPIGNGCGGSTYALGA